MLNKIAFFGPAASGKTWCANYLIAAYQYERVSFAAKLKEIATDLFGITGKNGEDRKVLQDLGTKMREIRPNVWIDYALNKANQISDSHYFMTEHVKNDPDCPVAHEPLSQGIVLDDLRYLNEYDALREAGWTLVKVVVPEEIRQWRLGKLYPDTPLSTYYHASEQEWERMTPDFSVPSWTDRETEAALDTLMGNLKVKKFLG